ncbi:unnamed protein product [Lampetra fluviatilis]
MAAKQRRDVRPAAPPSFTGVGDPGAVRKMIFPPSPSCESVQPAVEVTGSGVRREKRRRRKEAASAAAAGGGAAGGARGRQRERGEEEEEGGDSSSERESREEDGAAATARLVTHDGRGERGHSATPPARVGPGSRYSSVLEECQSQEKI